jgi:hypothetical protein
MMEEAFRAILTGAAPVTALVPIDRIVVGDVQEGAAYPFITIMVVSGAEGITFAGRDGLLQARLQVDCYGIGMLQTKQISRAVIAALHCYANGDFQGIFHETTRDTREGGSNEAVRPFRSSLDFMAHWRQL